MAVELVQEITIITQEQRESMFLLRRLSMALQQGNAVSFRNTMTNKNSPLQPLLYLIFMPAVLFCAE